MDRNLKEVRWLLNFYHKRSSIGIKNDNYDQLFAIEKQAITYNCIGLSKILKAKATGKSALNGYINYGATPLLFAIYTNDRDIFKLVYKFCTSIDEADGNIIILLLL